MHVASGVAIGERVDVEGVDLGDITLEPRGRRFDDAEERATVPP
jgi:hypothetical protein